VQDAKIGPDKDIPHISPQTVVTYDFPALVAASRALA
jgi:hypothetical protein